MRRWIYLEEQVGRTGVWRHNSSSVNYMNWLFYLELPPVGVLASRTPRAVAPSFRWLYERQWLWNRTVWGSVLITLYYGLKQGWQIRQIVNLWYFICNKLSCVNDKRRSDSTCWTRKILLKHPKKISNIVALWQFSKTVETMLAPFRSHMKEIFVKWLKDLWFEGCPNCGNFILVWWFFEGYF